MITMYDTVTLSTVPLNPPAVAGYTGGWWPTYSPLVAKFPNAKHLSIAVTAQEDAEALDVEAGDAVPAQVPAWVKRQKARGVSRPVVYASVSVMPEILSILSQAGIARADVRLWTAHYTYRSHLCSPSCGFGFSTTADATQFDNHALGRNLDQSTCADDFFFKPGPPARNSPHYDWFDAVPHRIFGKYYDERALVRSYDHVRATQTHDRHPHRPQLALLRFALKLAAGRVYRVAHNNPTPARKPSWGLYHRGWRYQNLIHRAQGARVV